MLTSSPTATTVPVVISMDRADTQNGPPMTTRATSWPRPIQTRWTLIARRPKNRAAYGVAQTKKNRASVVAEPVDATPTVITAWTTMMQPWSVQLRQGRAPRSRMNPPRAIAQAAIARTARSPCRSPCGTRIQPMATSPP